MPNWQISLKMHISQLALPATGTFRRIFLFYWEFECLNCRCTLYFVFVLFDIADLKKVVLIEHFFYFWKVLVIRKTFSISYCFFRSSLGTKKLIEFFAWKLSFVKILPLIRAFLIRAHLLNIIYTIIVDNNFMINLYFKLILIFIRWKNTKNESVGECTSWGGVIFDTSDWLGLSGHNFFI